MYFESGLQNNAFAGRRDVRIILPSVPSVWWLSVPQLGGGSRMDISNVIDSDDTDNCHR